MRPSDEDTGAYAIGYIPGAIAIDWKAELHARPRRDFVSSEALAELLGRKGISSDQTIVLYGGNYDGSWTEYGSMVGLPVER